MTRERRLAIAALVALALVETIAPHLPDPGTVIQIAGSGWSRSRWRPSPSPWSPIRPPPRAWLAAAIVLGIAASAGADPPRLPHHAGHDHQAGGGGGHRTAAGVVSARPLRGDRRGARDRRRRHRQRRRRADPRDRGPPPQDARHADAQPAPMGSFGVAQIGASDLVFFAFFTAAGRDAGTAPSRHVGGDDRLLRRHPRAGLHLRPGVPALPLLVAGVPGGQRRPAARRRHDRRTIPPNGSETPAVCGRYIRMGSSCTPRRLATLALCVFSVLLAPAAAHADGRWVVQTPPPTGRRRRRARQRPPTPTGWCSRCGSAGATPAGLTSTLQEMYDPSQPDVSEVAHARQFHPRFSPAPGGGADGALVAGEPGIQRRRRAARTTCS